MIQVKDPVLPIEHCTLRSLGSHFCDVENSEALILFVARIEIFNNNDQGGKRPGGETGSPLLVQCVMRRRTGTSAPSALPVQLMAAKNLLSTNRK